MAYRMLGSASEADDAVQEAWLHASRAGIDGVHNVGGFLTTIVARVCLDMLRARKARHEAPAPARAPAAPGDPEREIELADSVGLALLVVLELLEPAERLAFVLHDMFALSFDEIAPIVGRSEVAARQLASRARRRLQGSERPAAAKDREREVVAAYLAAVRANDLDALLRVLDPEVVLRYDAAAAPTGVARELRGARSVARGAIAGGHRARFARAALIDGAVGILVAPLGRLRLALRCKIQGDRIVELEAIGERARLEQLEIALLDPP